MARNRAPPVSNIDDEKDRVGSARARLWPAGVAADRPQVESRRYPDRNGRRARRSPCDNGLAYDRAMTDHAGSCHCGRITMTFSTGIVPEDFVARADQCGFCQRHCAMAIADPAGSLVVRLPVDAPMPYRFGLGITDFHVCDRCGVWVAATWRDGERLYGVVNVPALDERARFATAPVAVDFDDEDVAAREARRRANWTPARVEIGRAE